jgi:tRNA-dihydrouridine synthase
VTAHNPAIDEARENRAEELMLELAPTSLKGIAALAALAWVYVNPGCTDPEEFAECAQTYDCRAVMAIWRACTGRDGYPTT